MDELTRDFLIESQEGLDRMERCLTDLEERPHDTGLLAEIFRSVHTIKGTTGFLGFKRLEKLAHAGENLLGMLREGKLTADAEKITALLQLLDGLRSILRSIEADGSEGEDDDALLICRLEDLQAPALANARLEACLKAGMEPTPGQSSESAIESEPRAPVQPSARRESIFCSAVRRALPDRPIRRQGAEGSRCGAGPSARAGRRGRREHVARGCDVAEPDDEPGGRIGADPQSGLAGHPADPNMTVLSRRLDMVTADLRESVMKARMQPVSNIFSKMPRMVRDLSQSLGRRVRLQVEGQDTELDKSLLEAIKDPLTHAVRNSMDHGIEPPEVRLAAGKDPEGILRLRAAQEGSHVIIEVCDDGAGISVEKVRQKSIERGLITKERAANLSERELLQLIFVPGFSTASAVTNVSGRGVGMDVVRTNVERIGGKVEIDSRVGKGTTLRLRIPLTLAIIPALIVRSVNQSFALPQGALSELVHVPPSQTGSAIEWMEGAPLYRLRGQLLPLVFLDRLLMPEGKHVDAAERDNFIAVLDADGRRFGLVVDGLADPEEIVVKPLSPVLKDIGLYSGATVLGNADLALILDPGAIAMKAGIAMTGEEEIAFAVEGECSAEAEKDTEFLLVEVAGRQAAVPLAEVLRIEQLPAERIEYIGYRPVINFEGHLLPVEDSGGVLTGAQANKDEQVAVVVCRQGERQVGIAVSHVLDVAAGGSLVEAGTRQISAGVTLLKNRVTGVVDLGGMAPPPEADSTRHAVEEIAEETA